MQVRHALRADRDATAAAMAAGFAQDPFFAWMLPDEATRASSTTALMGLYFDCSLERGNAWVIGDAAGGAMWTPPDLDFLPEHALGTFFEIVQANAGAATDAILGGLLAFEDRHPPEPHWYLAALALEPAARGRGHGEALLEPILRCCDDEGLPAFLESSNPRNVTFYERLGFEVTEELAMPDGPTVPLLVRPPGATS